MVLFAYLGAFRGPVFNRLFSNGSLVIIGGMCYTIYLYHPFTISVFGRLLVRIPITHIYWIEFSAILLGVGFGTLAVCSCLFALLEKPFMRRDWPQRWWSGFKGLFRFKKQVIVLQSPTLSARGSQAENA
jgi:peptidoglycan/LPS O-acetylase OafA/YrhL